MAAETEESKLDELIGDAQQILDGISVFSPVDTGHIRESIENENYAEAGQTIEFAIGTLEEQTDELRDLLPMLDEIEAARDAERAEKAKGVTP